MTRSFRFVLVCFLWAASARPAVFAQSAGATADAPLAFTVAGRASSAPWIAAQGDIVAVAWAAAAEKAGPDIFVATSRDGGATFGAPVRVNAVAGDGRVSGEIPPRVAVSARPGGAPEIVVAWNAKDRGTEIKIARSRDGGTTFTPPVSLQSAGAAGDRGWHSLTLDDHGTAHVLWLDHRDLAAAKTAAPGMDHAAHGAHAAADAVADGSIAAQKSSLYYASYGAAASGERAITPGVCYCCKSAIVALPGGRLVSTWRHVYPGDMRDIAFTTSKDNGRTFAAPARVSADGWSINGCPDDGPALAAGADARVHIVWPTVIPGDEPVGALFYSTLDGAAFAPRTRVPTLGGPKPSHPQVVVEAGGRVVVAWDEAQDGMRTAAYVVGERRADGAVQFGTPQRLAAAGTPSTYPVMAVTSRGVVTAWTSGTAGKSVVLVRTLRPSSAPATAMDGPHAAQAPAQGAAPQHPMPHGGAPDHMEHRFDDPERYAKSFDDPARDAWQLPSRVIEALALTPGAKVADIGAGTGYFSMRLAAAAARPSVFAVDLEPAMVAHLTKRAAAEHRANVVAVQATASSPNLPEPVDVVLVVDTYHHIPKRAAYFAAMREKLRPGGRVAIVDFKKGVPGGPPDDFRFTPAQITQEMTDAGYTLAAEHDFLPRQLFLVYRVK